MVFESIKRAFTDTLSGGSGDEYLEIDVGEKEKNTKVLVKLFNLVNYEDVNDILSILREGYTIAIIDISVLRKKDSIELKRAISKIKKTTDALEGTIAGFGENMVIVTPPFAKIERETLKKRQSDERPKNKFED